MAKVNFKKVGSRLKSAGLMAGGAVIGNYASNFLNSKGVNPKLNAGIRLIGGALLPGLLGEGTKSGMITDICNGMMSEAAVGLAKAFNVPGVNGTDIDYPINGYGAGNNMAGTEIESSVN